MEGYIILCVIYLQTIDGLAQFRKLVKNMQANSGGNSLGHLNSCNSIYNISQILASGTKLTLLC